MDVSEKNYVENACSRCFWQKMKSLWRKDTDQNISARSLTLLTFAVGWALCGWPQREHDATAVNFFVKCFNPLKLYPMSGNIFRKWFASYFLFIHEHVIIMWSPMVTLVAVTTLLLTSSLHRW